MDKEGAVIRERMDETATDLADKIGALENEVTDRVRAAKDTVNRVRDSVNLKHLVRERPWAYLGGAVAMGFLCGRRAPKSGHSAGNGFSRLGDFSDHNGDTNRSMGRHHGNGNGWLSNLGDRLEPEIAELKTFALGTLMGVVREVIGGRNHSQSANEDAQQRSARPVYAEATAPRDW